MSLELTIDLELKICIRLFCHLFTLLCLTMLIFSTAQDAINKQQTNKNIEKSTFPI